MLWHNILWCRRDKFLYFSVVVPLSALLVTLTGCRVVAGVGGVLILISVLSSAFGTQLWHLIISYSCIGGTIDLTNRAHYLTSIAKCIILESPGITQYMKAWFWLSYSGKLSPNCQGRIFRKIWPPSFTQKQVILWKTGKNRHMLGLKSGQKLMTEQN